MLSMPSIAGAHPTGTEGGGQSSGERFGSLLGKLITIGGAPPLRAADQNSLSDERQEVWAGEAKELKGEVWETNQG
jgi:hypothetical protein